MYSLLLVDDEKPILDGLYYNVNWEEIGFTDVYRADNSKDALALMRLHRIDVIVSDIAMPGLDGIELCREALTLWPLAKVIFLSGYRSFEYAQRALAIGAFEYLIKPTPYPELLAVASRALDAIRTSIPRGEWQTANPSLAALRRERALIDWLLFGGEDTQVLRLLNPDEETAGMLLAFRLDTPPKNGMSASDVCAAAEKVLFPMDSVPERFTLPCALGAYLYVMLMPTLPTARAEYGRLCQHLDLYQETLLGDTGCDVSLLLHSPVPFSGLPDSTRRMEASLRSTRGQNGYLETEAEFQAAPRNEETQAESPHARLFAKIKQLVAERLRTGVTAGDLSSLLHYHPGYIARVVREEAGVSLGKYIIGRRMAVAKELIVQGMRVTDAALEVGYDNLSHFSRTYRKWFGVSPKQDIGS